MTHDLTTASVHPAFLQFVAEHLEGEETPDLSAWPYSARTFRNLRYKSRAALGEKAKK